MSLINRETVTTATPLQQLQEVNQNKKAELESGLLNEALAISNEKCNDLISRQNTLITVLTEKVKNVSVGNEQNVSDLQESVSCAVSEMKNLQDKTRTLNRTIATEINQAIKRTTTTWNVS